MAEASAHEAVRGQRSPHGLVPLVGRDPHEAGRAGSPLELIFDLVAVVAVSIAASNLEHLLSEGHWLQGIGTFAFATFGITWAWFSYSQQLSAFDTDDWGVRLVTLLQMAGVLVLALGIAPMVASVDAGGALGNQVMVLGYVLMRVGSIVLWARVARASPALRKTARLYIRALVISQVGWILQAFLPLPPTLGFVIMGVWLLQEVTYPLWAERTRGLPWHPEHLGERLSAFVIITLGEVVLGTFTAVQAQLTGPSHWLDAAAVGAAGLGLAFGVWWIYFIVPVGPVLGADRHRLYPTVLLHLVLYGSIAGIGAGLHLAATYADAQEHLSAVQVVLAVAAPTAAAVLMVYVCFTVLVPAFDLFHVALLLLTAAVAAIALWMAAAGVPVGACLLVLMAMPWVSVVGWELKGHRDASRRLERSLAALRLRARD